MMNEIFAEWLSQRPTFKPLSKWHPSLIPLILERHPKETSGFIQRTITGMPGYGKSTYAYKLMAKLCWTINGYTKIDDEEECYKWALDNMIYQPRELFAKIEKAILKGEPDWCWCLDDASIHMGRQLWDQSRQIYWDLQDNIPTIREDVTCLLITTPNVKLLAKPFREFFDMKVEMDLVEGIRRYPRKAKHYIKKYYPDDIRFRIYHPYDDRFSCLVPLPFYDWYREKKLDALREYHKAKKDRRANRVSAVEEESDAQS